MTSEPEFNAHVACEICGEILYRQDAIDVDGKYVCKEGTCKSDLYAKQQPGVQYEYCADCGRIRHKSEGRNTPDGWVCKGCERKRT